MTLKYWKKLIFRIISEPIVVRGHSCHSPKTFYAKSTYDSVVVLVKFGISFFQERHPPGTGTRRVGSKRSVLATIFCGGNSVINIDAIPTLFDPEIESESSLFVVLFVPEDSFDSLWLLSKGRSSGEEPTVSELVLRNSVGPRFFVRSVQLRLLFEASTVAFHVFGPNPMQACWWHVIRSNITILLIPKERAVISSELWIFPSSVDPLRVAESDPRVGIS